MNEQTQPVWNKWIINVIVKLDIHTIHPSITVTYVQSDG